jgi:hypothetical protein
MRAAIQTSQISANGHISHFDYLVRDQINSNAVEWNRKAGAAKTRLRSSLRLPISIAEAAIRDANSVASAAVIEAEGRQDVALDGDGPDRLGDRFDR